MRDSSVMLYVRGKCKLMHISLSGGGSRGLVHAAFFEHLQTSAEGKALMKKATSFSGVSAGALVATPLAMGVDPKKITRTFEEGGLTSWMHWPRVAMAMLGLRKSVYDGQVLYERLQGMCSAERLRYPLSLGVTTVSDMKQVSLRYTEQCSRDSLFNCAVASAAVPFLFSAREAGDSGLACDGGAIRCTFPVDAIVSAIRAGDEVTLVNAAPWPGFREVIGTRNERIFANAFDVFNEHGMEWLPRELGADTFAYKDGIFKHGNVTFIAPTGAQYAASGGTQAAGDLRYKGHSAFTRRLRQEGIEIANQYVQMKHMHQI